MASKQVHKIILMKQVLEVVREGREGRETEKGS
jgi:hypothetical protein